MRARPSLRFALIASKLRKWRTIALNPGTFNAPDRANRTTPSQARKNFWRLLAKYPEVGEAIGLQEDSVYPR